MPWANKKKTAADAERQRQYDSPEYRRIRAGIKLLVASGNAYCWRCTRHLPPGSKVHTGHDDNDRTIIRGAECVDCNLKTAASKGARVANANRKSSPLRW